MNRTVLWYHALIAILAREIIASRPDFAQNLIKPMETYGFLKMEKSEDAKKLIKLMENYDFGKVSRGWITKYPISTVAKPLQNKAKTDILAWPQQCRFGKGRGCEKAYKNKWDLSSFSAKIRKYLKIIEKVLPTQALCITLWQSQNTL